MLILLYFLSILFVLRLILEREIEMVIFMHLFAGSRYPEINKRISAWVNKNKEFPDYVDVLNLVKKVTKQSSLPLRPETVRVQG